MRKRTYEALRDGVWVAEDGATIHKVAPRFMTLYAVRLPGSKRPVWVDTLAEAKEVKE
jgi:hypothetical protein